MAKNAGKIVKKNGRNPNGSHWDIGIIDHDIIWGTVDLPQGYLDKENDDFTIKFVGTLISDKTKRVNSSKRLCSIYDNCGLS